MERSNSRAESAFHRLTECEPRFQRLHLWQTVFWGDAQAQSDMAPLALNSRLTVRAREKERKCLSHLRRRFRAR
jgi:hypothetical protein